MKILIVHNSYQQPGGEDAVFSQEQRLLRDAGHQVLAYCRNNDGLSGGSLLRRASHLRNAIWSRSSRNDFCELLRHSPDVVHVHNTFFAISPAIYSACHQANIPVVQTLHNYRLFCPGAYFLRDGNVCEECVQHSLLRSVRYGCYRNSHTTTAALALTLAVHRLLGTWTTEIDLYIALTEFARKKFVECGFPADKLVVKPNFVTPDPGARSGIGEYALFVGRLSPEKGVEAILQAWSLLKRPIPLWIVGDGPAKPELQALAERLDLKEVFFRGRLDRFSTLTAIKGARFLLFPSEWYECFPVTILESFACGVPVLASAIGAVRELVQEGKTGLLFAPKDAAHVADRVEWAWERPLQMQTMGENARDTYLTRYTAEKNYTVLMNIYHRAMARPSWEGAAQFNSTLA